ncbi:MAG: UDP-N-acetylmuramoyl-L-alanyl-D-glutamate--2,6-diaminopimelate ligase [Planctomycetota bacterium]
MWTLGRLAEELETTVEGNPETVISGVREDSRACAPGELFLAVRGTDDDGLHYARDAIQRGAVAVASERDPGAGVPWLRVPDARAAAGRLADLLYGDPSRQLALIGVTGTNGKTTTAHLVTQLLPGPVGFIGTTGIDWPGRVGGRTASLNTTPSPTTLRRYLRAMVDEGCIACVMEVSSHALAQARTDGLHFAAAIYTNLSGDHLDYHGTMEAYANAKARLFTGLESSAHAIFNATDPACARIETRARVHWFRPEEVRVTRDGTRFRWRDRDAELPFVGRHNAENAAAALEAVTALGADPDESLAAMRGATSARGRLEIVATDPVLVLVDYAHTDDALLQAIRATREVTEGKVIVVFGCGGDRDRSKRPRMGAVAAQWADRVYVTNDNPRTEDPARIASEIVAGTGNAGATVVLDRREAIRTALRHARPGDSVLIAGKGHESYQIVGDRRLDFDDVAVAREEYPR